MALISFNQSFSSEFLLCSRLVSQPLGTLSSSNLRSCLLKDYRFVVRQQEQPISQIFEFPISSSYRMTSIFFFEPLGESANLSLTPSTFMRHKDAAFCRMLRLHVPQIAISSSKACHLIRINKGGAFVSSSAKQTALILCPENLRKPRKCSVYVLGRIVCRVGQ